MEAAAAGDKLGSMPEPTVVQPAGTTPPPAYPSRDPPPPPQQQGEQLHIGEEVQFSEELEDRGLLESSTRLKPHEAQSYRKKALWVSWASIVVTLALAVAAFKSRLFIVIKIEHRFPETQDWCEIFKISSPGVRETECCYSICCLANLQ